MPSPSIPSNIIAFWLGFLAATVFWFIVNRLRPQIPRLRAAIRARISAMRRRVQDQIDDALRKEMLKRAQAMHLGASLFALDEVLVSPALLAPPSAFINPGTPAPDTITNQVMPYLPDWPELASAYPVAKLTLAEALKNGVPVAVIGQPGIGKTVTLADLASKVARRDPEAGPLADHTPVLVSIFDLPYQETTSNPLDGLISFLNHLTPVFAQSRLPAFIAQAAKSGALLILVDGLDELPPPMLEDAIHYLTRLLSEYPRIKCALTAIPQQASKLNQAGFLPLPLATWNHTQVVEFITQWGRQWQSMIAPTLERQSGKSVAVDQRLLLNWLSSEGGQLTPLEWTLKIWGTNCGDLSGARNRDAIDGFIRRYAQNHLPLQALVLLAAEYLAQSRPTLPFHHLDSFLSKTKITIDDHPQPAAEGKVQKAVRGNRRSKVNETRLTKVGQMLQALIDCGLLVEHTGEEIRLAHPVIAGYLAASAVPLESQAALFTPPTWSLQATTAQYLAAQTQSIPVLDAFLARDKEPFFPVLLTAARWLKDAPVNAAWRNSVLRRMLALTGSDNISLSQRGRLCAAFLTSGDPGISVLYKQFMTSPSPSLRQLTALCCGILRSTQLVDCLISLLADPVPDVRCAACLALASVENPLANEAVTGALQNGDESLQLAVAETLACGSAEGQELLKEALASDNLMTRRAAVMGLASVRDPWARALLEKAAVEDGQWAVRNAAAQALERQQKQAQFSLTPLPPPDSSPWLIAFAGKQGMGVATDRVPTDLLLDALERGTGEERLGALTYLRSIQDSPVATRIKNLADSEQGILCEAALYSLWLMEPARAEPRTNE